MKRSLVVFCASALVFALAGCSEAPADNRDAAVKALKDTEVQWNNDFAAKDFDKLVAHYTDDATFMVGGSPEAVGKNAIQKEYKDLLADPNLSIKFESTKSEVAKSGDLAYTQGTYAMTVTDPVTKKVINDKGSYVTVWKKQPDGSWKAVQDATISAVPPPAPEPPKMARARKHRKK
jgi:uncharacterized protein (TIGR02246 family)